jgi:transposase
MDDRRAMSAIFYVLRTGCQWNALPRSLGASSTVAASISGQLISNFRFSLYLSHML